MLVLLCLVCAVAPPADGPVKIVPFKGDAVRVRVVAVLPPAAARGLPAGELKQEQGERLLSFARIDARSGKTGDGMFGRYEHDKGKLVFTPRHALLDGERYRATLALGEKKAATTEYAVPAKVIVGVPSVVMIYPTIDVLPANHLKFYLYFSRPMRETETIFDQLRILDDKGKPVEDPWRLTQLWNADCTRLTLLIHPGRIKKGVNLNEEIGPVLEPNRKYTLEIDARVRDADDVPLGKTYKKQFSTTKAERSFVLVEDWTLKAPKQGTREALSLTFPKPLDHALLQRMVMVVDRDKKPIAGRVILGRDEKSLTFVPAAPWQAMEYRVVVDPDLEDLAGNTPEQLFDVNNEAPETPPKPQTLKFRPAR